MRVYDQSATGISGLIVRYGANQSINNHAISIQTSAGSEIGYFGDSNGTLWGDTGAFVLSTNTAAMGQYGAFTSKSTGVLGWTHDANVYDTKDTGLSRYGAGVLAVGNGLQGNATGTLIAGNIGIGTTAPTSTLFVQGSSTTTPFVVASSTGTQLLSVSTAGALTASDYPNCSGFTTNSGGLIQCTASDERLKQEIIPLGTASGLAAINALNPVSFYWLDPTRGTTEQFGFIAQQVQQIFRNLVSTTTPTALTPGGTLTLNYDGLISPLILATQELSASSTAMQNQLERLQLTVNSLQGNLSGNATSSSLTVYSPSDFSGDSVGEAEITSGQTSVRVTFSQPYAFQPIVTFSPEGEFAPAFIAEKDSAGFILDLEAATTSAITFDWHSFASPTEQLTVSGGEAQAITLVVATSTPTTDQPLIVSADSASSSAETPTASDSCATGTPEVSGTSTPASDQDSGDSTTTALAASPPTPTVIPTPTPTVSPTPTAPPIPSPSPTPIPAAVAPAADSGTSADQGSNSGS